MENDFHKWLLKNVSTPAFARVGIGDDAAVVDLGAEDTVLATDMLADGVHFDCETTDATLIGRKCLAVNLSDLAAMGARPVCALVSLMLPRSNADSLAPSLLKGMQKLADEFGLAIVGGDTNTWDGRLVVSVSVVGSLEHRALRRDTASAGDVVFVSGRLGGSILGHHLSFTPRIELGHRLAQLESVTATMDISDGLAMDAHRMARLSGCGMELLADQIPVSDAAHAMVKGGSGKTALQHGIADGEDFELLIACDPSKADDLRKDTSLGLIEVGRCVEEPGVWMIDSKQGRAPLSPVGYEHGTS